MFHGGLETEQTQDPQKGGPTTPQRGPRRAESLYRSVAFGNAEKWWRSYLGSAPLTGMFGVSLEEGLLLLNFRQSALQLLHTFLESLIVETEPIETIQQLLALDIRPFQRAPQSGQL